MCHKLQILNTLLFFQQIFCFNQHFLLHFQLALIFSIGNSLHDIDAMIVDLMSNVTKEHGTRTISKNRNDIKIDLKFMQISFSDTFDTSLY